MADKKNTDEKVDFGTEIFFIEDPKFFEELQKQTPEKQNPDEFIWGDAIISPGKVKIRKRTEDWSVKTSSFPRKDIKGKKGDFLLRGPNGKLKVTAAKFEKIYAKIIS